MEEVDFHRQPSYRSAGGEKVSTADLEKGDWVALKVNWGRNWREHPTFFQVEEPLSDHEKEMIENGDTPMASIKLRGVNGHKYRKYTDNPHVECLTDDKDGFARGTNGAKPKKL